MVIFGVIALMGGLVQINPDLAVRAVRGVGGLRGQSARLVHHVPGQVDPAHAPTGTST